MFIKWEIAGRYADDLSVGSVRYSLCCLVSFLAFDSAHHRPFRYHCGSRSIFSPGLQSVFQSAPKNACPNRFKAAWSIRALVGHESDSDHDRGMSTSEMVEFAEPTSKKRTDDKPQDRRCINEAATTTTTTANRAADCGVHVHQEAVVNSAADVNAKGTATTMSPPSQPPPARLWLRQRSGGQLSSSTSLGKRSTPDGVSAASAVAVAVADSKEGGTPLCKRRIEFDSSSSSSASCIDYSNFQSNGHARKAVEEESVPVILGAGGMTTCLPPVAIPSNSVCSDEAPSFNLGTERDLADMEFDLSYLTNRETTTLPDATPFGSNMTTATGWKSSFDQIESSVESFNLCSPSSRPLGKHSRTMDRLQLSYPDCSLRQVHRLPPTG